MAWQLVPAPAATKAQIESGQPGEIILAVRVDGDTGETELLVGFNDRAPRWVGVSEVSAIFHSRDY
jgi:hypothetical protein